MKILFLFLVYLKEILSKDISEYQCKLEILQYYGFEGLPSPQNYQSIVATINNDLCPNMKHSCCSRLDYLKTQRIWDQKVRDMKKYITKIFRVIQKITAMQSSLLELADEVRDKDTDKCKLVDFTFFDSPIKYKDVYFYLQNALDAFAFMQKGYYCMICDSQYHDYMAIEMDQTRRINIISHKFCNDLIFFFREFIMFKVYYLDPLMINTNLLFNCYEDNEFYQFNLYYNTTFANIQSCVEEGENCEYVCKEFKFGTTSDLFIGRLSKYEEFLRAMQEVIKRYDPKLQLAPNNPHQELYLDEQTYPEEFFIDPEQGIPEQSYFVLKDYNFTQFELNVEEEGLNLFDIATKSNFFLTNQMTQKIVDQHYGTHYPGEDNDMKGGTALDEFNYERNHIPELFDQARIKQQQEKDDFEENRDYQRAQLNPNRPSKQDLIDLMKQQTQLKEEYDQMTRKEADQLQYKYNPTDFSNTYNNILLNSIKMFIIFILF